MVNNSWPISTKPTFFRWEVIVGFVDIGRIVDHQLFKLSLGERWFLGFVDIGRIDDHHCLNFL